MILVWRFTVAATLCLLFKLKQIKPIKRHVYEHYLIQHSYSFHFLDSFLLEVLEERRQVNCLRASQWQDHAKTPHSLTHDTTIQLNTCSQRGNEKRPSQFCPRHIDIKIYYIVHVWQSYRIFPSVSCSGFFLSRFIVVLLILSTNYKEKLLKTVFKQKHDHQDVYTGEIKQAVNTGSNKYICIRETHCNLVLNDNTASVQLRYINKFTGTKRSLETAISCQRLTDCLLEFNVAFHS